MGISLSNVPTEGIAHGTLYIGKGDGTFEELCAVTDIPEVTSNIEEEVENKINLDYWHGMEFTFEIRRGTRSWRNLQRLQTGWTAKGPIRRRARRKAFQYMIWRLYLI